MPKRIAVTNLNASTLDILNTIRANLSQEYQDNVPAISDSRDIPRVGEIIYGYPRFANAFINELINRIAMVRIKSATFNNAYAKFKKGYLEFGETVEEVFVNITKAREFSVEKAAAREFKRSLPDVRTAFHAMNYKAQYPITIQQEDLRQAFLSADGVTDLIAKVVNAVNVAAEYDEFLLFKYLLIKAIAHGKMYAVGVNTANMADAAVAFRGMANALKFMSKEYNISHVTTNTDTADQNIFMDAKFNAKYDVNVLASAFNMDKATFQGNLTLIDSFTAFDNDRFTELVGAGQMEAVTDDELALMKNVRAVLVDTEWFQVYDNLTQMGETPVNSGMYWNYFFNVWKTVSSSPFSNAIVFVEGNQPAAPATVKVKIEDKQVEGDGATTIFTLVPADATSVAPSEMRFTQTNSAAQAKIAIHPYGAIIMPTGTTTTLESTIGNASYKADKAITPTSTVGTEFTFTKQ